MSQADRIYTYMQDFGSISPMEAFADLGITKLATRISEMRRDGIEIIGELEHSRNRYGEKTHYMRYTLGGES